MLKDKLYSEYQKRYTEYKEKQQRVDILKEAVKQLESERKGKKNDIENQKEKTLSDISGKKKDFERKLASVKREGTNSLVVKEYSEHKLREIEALEENVRVFEQSKKSEIKELEKKKKDIVINLESDKELCQKRLNNLMSGGGESDFVKTFDEGKLRQQLEREKEREIAKLSAQYDSSITYTQNSLQNIDNEYTSILKKEISYVEDDSNLRELYNELKNKLSENELPQIITHALQEPVDRVIQRQGINGGQRVAQLARWATSLDNLNQYTPEWLINLVNIGFPAIFGIGIFLIVIFSGIHISFVATATNAIATFLL